MPGLESLALNRENALKVCKDLGFRNPVVTYESPTGIEVLVRTQMSIVIQRMGPHFKSTFWEWDGGRHLNLNVRTERGMRRISLVNASNPLVSQIPSVFIFFDDRPLSSKKRPYNLPYPYVKLNPQG